VLSARPVRGSSVAGDPSDVVPVVVVVLVVFIVVFVEVGTVVDEFEVERSAVGVGVDEFTRWFDVTSGGSVVDADPAEALEIAPDGGGVDEELVSVAVESGSAEAIPGLLATAAPTPNATARAPTRPTYVP
jgi:hypothetical protein